MKTAIALEHEDRVVGTVLGLALGDAFGAPYEGGWVERAVWKVIGKSKGKQRWTDDTQMSVDLARSLVKQDGVNQDALAQRFARSYKWSRGYGQGTTQLLKQIQAGTHWLEANTQVYEDGSYGNGGAMRAGIIGAFYALEAQREMVQAAIDATTVTHAHPHGIEGAVHIAIATAVGFENASPQETFDAMKRRALAPVFLSKIQTARGWFDGAQGVSSQVVAETLGNGMAAVESVVTAVTIALLHDQAKFDELLAFAIEVGGDVDTIAAMAGAVWGARHGYHSLPAARLEALEDREGLEKVGKALAKVAQRRAG